MACSITTVLSESSSERAHLEVDNYAEIVKLAVKSLIEDSSFQLPVQQCRAALDTASAVLSWSAQNWSQFSVFATEVAALLRTCFVSVASLKVTKEKMWGNFHKVRTSDEFKRLWTKFLMESVHHMPTPTFYQYVTDAIFTSLVRAQFPTSEESSNDSPTNMTFEEANALHYVAGYVCRKIRKKLENLKDKDKDEMILFLMEVAGDQEDSDDDGPESWCNSIDRGGLWHIKDSVYELFRSMEAVIRGKLTPATVTRQIVGCRQELEQAILNDEDVLFNWCTFAESTDDSIANPVLKMLVELYVTVCGFAYTDSCLELYKQAKRRMTQKSKGIRKGLVTSKIS